MAPLINAFARMLIARATRPPRIPQSQRSIRLGIVILPLFCPIWPANGAGPDASMESVIRVARANCERIKTLDVFWTEDNQPSEQPTEGILPSTDGTSYLPRLFRLTKEFSTGRYRYEERQDFADGRKDDNPYLEAFDGKVRTAYPWRDYNGPSVGRFAGYIQGLQASCLGAQPRANDAAGVCKAYAPFDFPFPPRFLEYLTECKARPGREMAGGRDCLVADHFAHGKLEGRIWLDMERGALPVREIVFEKPGKNPNYFGQGLDNVSGVMEAHEFTDGKVRSTWMPTRMFESDAYGTCTEEVDIARTRLNSAIDPRQFRVTFPTGAPVFNPATGYFFTTNPNDPSMDETLPSYPATQPATPAR